MKPTVTFFLMTVCLLLFACKKEKSIVFTGRLLFTHKNPFPIAARGVQIYQSGSGAGIGIPAYSTSANAETKTDAAGFFKLVFTPGTTTFLIFSGSSSSPLTFSGVYGDTSFYSFYRKNFPDSAYDPSKPIYVGKTIDTAIIKVQTTTALAVNDTIGLRGYTTTGMLDKQYTGRTAPAGSVIVLDTIYNTLFTEYDCRLKSFRNSLYGGRKYSTSLEYASILDGYTFPSVLSEADQGKQEFQFYFQK